MHAASRYRLGDLIVDVDRQRVERDGEPLNVTGLSFQLLRYLMMQGDRVIGFDELIAQVWSPAVVNEETVTQRVKLLRQALGDDGRRPRYLRSVRGQGYQLCERPEPITTGAFADAAAASAHERGAGPSPKFVIAAVMLLIVVLCGGLAWLWTSGSTPAPTTAATPVSPTAAMKERASYYAAIGQRDDNERAIALYERVLQQTPEDTSAMLGLSRGYSARVCQFNFPPEWAERAQALAQRVLAREPRNGRAEAALGYAHDCRGRIDDALAHYERAFGIDPADDNSRASAAYLYERKGRLADAVVANHAIRGDPARVRFLSLQIASNLDLLGYPQAAEAIYRRSFSLFPDNVFSNSAWPRFLFRHGRLSEAEEALREAMQRGTEHTDLHLLAAELAWVQGRREDAAAATGAAVRLRPQASLPTTLARLQSGVFDAGWARSRAEMLAGELAQGAGYSSDWLEVALLQDAAGDRAGALHSLQRAVDEGYRDADYLRVSPWFKPMANEPAFARIIDRIARDIAAERARIPPALLARITASP